VGVVCVKVCREWLQRQLSEVFSIKIQGNGEYGMFKGQLVKGSSGNRTPGSRFFPDLVDTWADH